MHIHENVEFANKINQLVKANNELAGEVWRLRNVISDIQNERVLRLAFAWHIRKPFPFIVPILKPMDVPPMEFTVAEPVTRPVPVRSVVPKRGAAS